MPRGGIVNHERHIEKAFRLGEVCEEWMAGQYEALAGYHLYPAAVAEIRRFQKEIDTFDEWMDEDGSRETMPPRVDITAFRTRLRELGFSNFGETVRFHPVPIEFEVKQRFSFDRRQNWQYAIQQLTEAGHLWVRDRIDTYIREHPTAVPHNVIGRFCHVHTGN